MIFHFESLVLKNDNKTSTSIIKATYDVNGFFFFFWQVQGM
jgi:hypothetical protein